MRRSVVSRTSGLIAALLVALSAPGSALAHGVAHFEAAHHDAHVDEHVGERHGEHEAAHHPSPVDHDLDHGPARAEIGATDHPADHGHQTLGPATTGRLDSPLMLPAQVPAQWTAVVASRDELRPERMARQELATREGVPRQPRAPPLG